MEGTFQMKGKNADPKNYIIHPHKFGTWLFIVSIILMFGGLTSAYIVSKGIELENDRWIYFNLPSIFYITTAVLILSSVTMQWSVVAARRGNKKAMMGGLYLTLLHGLLFLVGQVQAWKFMYEGGIILGDKTTNAGSYLYLLTGLHGAHIIMGLLFVTVIIVKASRGKITKENTVPIENCATFWHFLDLLWIYLFIFLLINQS